MRSNLFQVLEPSRSLFPEFEDSILLPGLPDDEPLGMLIDEAGSSDVLLEKRAVLCSVSLSTL